MTVPLTPDVKRTETTGKRKKKEKPPPGIEQQLQPGFTPPGVFVLKSCKLQMVEREKKKTAWWIKGSKSSTEKTHRPRKAAIQSNGCIIAVLWGPYTGIMHPIEFVLCIVYSHSLMDPNERKISADKGMTGFLFGHYNDLMGSEVTHSKVPSEELACSGRGIRK